MKIKAVSQQDYDDASAALKQAEADVASAKAAVETARINLAYTKVTAPISGRIGRSTVTDGALVTANQPTALATIQQLDSMYVDVTQSTAELLKLKQNLANGVLKKQRLSGAGQAAAGRRLRLSVAGNTEIFRSHRGSEHRFRHPAGDLPQPETDPAARHVCPRHPGGRGQ